MAACVVKSLGSAKRFPAMLKIDAGNLKIRSISGWARRSLLDAECRWKYRNREPKNSSWMDVGFDDNGSRLASICIFYTTKSSLVTVFGIEIMSGDCTMIVSELDLLMTGGSAITGWRIAMDNDFEFANPTNIQHNVATQQYKEVGIFCSTSIYFL